MSGKPRLTAKQKRVMKQTICELLEKTPVIESACQKVSISRMTLSRWRKDDPKFDQQIEEVLAVSRESVNDLAESKMIQAINDGNPSLIRFWLTNNCNRYKRKPDISQHININKHEWGEDDFVAMMNALPEMIKNRNPDEDDS